MIADATRHVSITDCQGHQIHISTVRKHMVSVGFSSLELLPIIFKSLAKYFICKIVNAQCHSVLSVV